MMQDTGPQCFEKVGSRSQNETENVIITGNHYSAQGQLQEIIELLRRTILDKGETTSNTVQMSNKGSSKKETYNVVDDLYQLRADISVGNYWILRQHYEQC